MENPVALILYSAPKVGKTTLLSTLDDCLIIDLERGTKYLETLKVSISSLKELDEVCTALEQYKQENGEFKYRRIAVDTITKLEDWCEPLAKSLYKATPMGKNFDKDNQNISVLSLPNGAGYKYLRDAFNMWLNRLMECAEEVIFIGHLKEKFIEKNGKEVTASELLLTGKIAPNTAAAADAIGYLYRKGPELWVSFKNKREVTCGARPNHLRGQDFMIAEMTEDNKFISYWDKIYK